MQPATLQDRAVITVSGQDAQDFLQALITTDLDLLEDAEAKPGALLTPQGKILFDFMVTRDGTTIRLETGIEQAEALLKRLTMYKLRAPISLALTNPADVSIRFDAAPGAYADARFAKAGQAVYRVYGPAGATTGAGDYDRLRIANGIAVSGADYALQDAFPHDVLMDKNGALSFKKGCYVGQEVVSRMQHRGTARRRVVIAAAETALPETGTPPHRQGPLDRRAWQRYRRLGSGDRAHRQGWRSHRLGRADPCRRCRGNAHPARLDRARFPGRGR